MTTYILEPREPDVLRSLRGLTEAEYEQVLVIIGSFKRPLGPEVEEAGDGIEGEGW